MKNKVYAVYLFHQNNLNMELLISDLDKATADDLANKLNGLTIKDYTFCFLVVEKGAKKWEKKLSITG